MWFYLSACYSFFFNHTATTEIYTLSLHDALPICDETALGKRGLTREHERDRVWILVVDEPALPRDRKSTRLNSSHVEISYAVFCLKKKNKANRARRQRQPLLHAPISCAE